MQKERLPPFPISGVLTVFGRHGRHQDQIGSEWTRLWDCKERAGTGELAFTRQGGRRRYRAAQWPHGGLQRPASPRPQVHHASQVLHPGAESLPSPRAQSLLPKRPQMLSLFLLVQ